MQNQSKCSIVDPSHDEIYKNTSAPTAQGMLQKREQKDCVSQRIRELALRLGLNNIRTCTHKVLPARLPQHEVSKRNHKRHANMEARMTTRP